MFSVGFALKEMNAPRPFYRVRRTYVIEEAVAETLPEAIKRFEAQS